MRTYAPKLFQVRPHATLPVMIQPELCNEVLNDLNGVIRQFTTDFAFNPDTVVVSLNGLIQQQPLDYTTVGYRTILMQESPEIGDSLQVQYWKLWPGQQ